MSMTIYTNGAIELDGQATGLHVRQKETGTVVYPSGYVGSGAVRVRMPHERYSLAHDAPASSVPGRAQFEQDLRAHLIDKAN